LLVILSKPLTLLVYAARTPRVGID